MLGMIEHTSWPKDVDGFYQKLKHKHGWFSGIIAACHAADPGSIPGPCIGLSLCLLDREGRGPVILPQLGLRQSRIAQTFCLALSFCPIIYSTQFYSIPKVFGQLAIPAPFFQTTDVSSRATSASRRPTTSSSTTVWRRAAAWADGCGQARDWKPSRGRFSVQDAERRIWNQV